MEERIYNENTVSFELPYAVRTALSVFKEHGYRAYVVGGAVRDILRGAPVHDWDIATETNPHLTKQLFCDYPTYDIGMKHGTVTVNIDGELIEITTFRTDGEYKDSRHPEQVIFTNSLCEDLKRRDFTVNAMAMNLAGEIEDPFGGKKDLANNIIRAVGVPVDRFTEDALRIMRAYRFSATLLYDIEYETLKATSICAHRLDNISRERINEEWKKTITAPFCSKALVMMRKCGILSFIFPGLKVDAEYLRRLDTLPNEYTLRSAAFFRNCLNEYFESASSRINFSKNEAAEVRMIIEAYRSIVNDCKQSLRHFCYKYRKCAEYATIIAVHDLLVPEEVLFAVRDTFEDETMIWSRKDLKVDGNLIKENFEVEPFFIGRLIDDLVLMVLDEEIENDREALLEEIEILLDS